MSDELPRVEVYRCKVHTDIYTLCLGDRRLTATKCCVNQYATRVCHWRVTDRMRRNLIDELSDIAKAPSHD